MEAKGNRGMPGAGTYKIPSMIGEGPQYGIQGRQEKGSSPMKNNPGPGTYNIQSVDNLRMHNSQKYGIGTSLRSNDKPKLNVPGPGNYQPNMADLKAAPKFGFGSDTRDGGNNPPRHSALFPGPGAYKPKPFVGNEGVQCSIHGKLKSQTLDAQRPGPGAYDSTLRNKKTAPAYG